MFSLIPLLGQDFDPTLDFINHCQMNRLTIVYLTYFPNFRLASGSTRYLPGDEFANLKQARFMLKSSLNLLAIQLLTYC